ncbi:hypothetical protein M1M87_00700 [Thermodesulfovibrionales bacterium]|nr:hypothetical protein [Thermodesulfovibrionales bacterium]MCL0047182.1 hypothetical protein [Thermodesulfovibrionales bacterium]MCL0049915.1 hypothetical protein [Thermodesulfovibrionales bacterium]MCL0096426.1 hypothetical protein [Thermodesulfovibrionales bacterium]
MQVDLTGDEREMLRQIVEGRLSNIREGVKEDCWCQGWWFTKPSLQPEKEEALLADIVKKLC